MSNPLDPVNIGMDLGNATTSGVTAEGNDRVSFFPSVIASLGIKPYGGMSKANGGYHHVTYDGKHYVIGEEALNETGAYPLLSPGLAAGEAWTRYTSAESFACFLASVSALYRDADMVAVNLGTGAPLSMYEAYGDKIAKRFVGEHRYTYNGHERTVIVARARCFGEGREVLRLVPREERTGKVAVYDLGGRTLNVAFFMHGDLKMTVTKDFGVERLFKFVGDVEDDLAVRWKIVKEMRENNRAHPGVRDQLVTLLNSALDVITREVALGAAEQHLLVGGGAFLLERVLKQRFANVRVLHGKTPEAANAKAFALAIGEM